MKIHKYKAPYSGKLHKRQKINEIEEPGTPGALVKHTSTTKKQEDSIRNE